MVRLSLGQSLSAPIRTKPQVHEYDTLTSEARWDDDFDVILANPPFMTPKGGFVRTSVFKSRPIARRSYL